MTSRQESFQKAYRVQCQSLGHPLRDRRYSRIQSIHIFAFVLSPLNVTDYSRLYASPLFWDVKNYHLQQGYADLRL